MAIPRKSIHSFFLLLLPIAVAYFGISTIGAAALVLIGVVWRLAITASLLLFPPDLPALQLETIGVSHYAEKVRWCMDRLGVDYVERQSAGIIGLVFGGRTVPQLKFRTGRVVSVIGNSHEILRYLFGAYAPSLGEKAAFLHATEEHVAMEERIDQYGLDLQVWIYFQVLSDRSLTLDVWGRNSPDLPRWQRLAIVMLYPLLRAFVSRAFQLSESTCTAAVERIEDFLEDVEARLSDGRPSLLGDDAIDYVDITLAAISALWVQPEAFGAGKTNGIRVERDRFPEAMRTQVMHWHLRYPTTIAFVESLYAKERQST
jgi:hypothetical protein